MYAFAAKKDQTENKEKRVNSLKDTGRTVKFCFHLPSSYFRRISIIYLTWKRMEESNGSEIELPKTFLTN